MSFSHVFVFCFFKFFAVFFLINFCKLKDLIVFLLVYIYICFTFAIIIIIIYTCTVYIYTVQSQNNVRQFCLLLKPFANSGAPDGNCAYNLKNSDESLTIELLGDYSRTQCILFGFFYNSSFWQTQGTSQPETRNKTSTLRTLVRNLTEGQRIVGLILICS